MYVSQESVLDGQTDDLHVIRQIRGLSQLQLSLHEFRASGVEVIVRRTGRERYQLLASRQELEASPVTPSASVGRSRMRQKFEFDVGWVPGPIEESRRLSQPRLKRVALIFAGVSSLAAGIWLRGSLITQAAPKPASQTAVPASGPITPSTNNSACREPFASGEVWNPSSGIATSSKSDLDFGGMRYLEVTVDCSGVGSNYKVQLRFVDQVWVIENAVRSEKTEPRS